MQIDKLLQKGDATNRLEKAIIFAHRAHSRQLRKGTNTPYILHPMEAAAIVATMTDDPEIIPVAVLHDPIEDAGISPDEIAAKFGARVANLVHEETEDKRGVIQLREKTVGTLPIF